MLPDEDDLNPPSPSREHGQDVENGGDQDDKQQETEYWSSIPIMGQRKFTDIIWSLAFLGHLAMVVLLFVFPEAEHAHQKYPAVIGTFLFASISASYLVGVVPVVLAFLLPSKFPVLTQILFFVSGLIFFIWLLVIGAFSISLLVAFFLIYGIVWAVKTKESVQSAGATFELIGSIARKYRSVVVLCVVVITLQTAWLMVWGYATYQVIRFDNFGSHFALSFLLFSLYWTTQVSSCFLNIIVSSVCGAVYSQQAERGFSDLGDMQLTNRSLLSMDDPVRNGLKRALSHSFGSVCFAGLTVGAIRTVRRLLGRRVDLEEPNLLKKFRSLVRSIFQVLERRFNKYGLTQVSLLGKDFISASQDVWNLLEETGVDVVVMEDLISPLVSRATFFAGSLVACFCSMAGAVALQHDFWLQLLLLLTCVCYAQASVWLELFDSANCSLLVLFAENPQPFSSLDPIIYHRLMRIAELGRLRLGA